MAGLKDEHQAWIAVFNRRVREAKEQFRATGEPRVWPEWWADTITGEAD